MFDGPLCSASKVSTGMPHVFPKVFAASQYAAMPDVVAHAGSSFLYLGAAFFHLPAGSVAIPLRHAAHRQQGWR